MSKKITAEFLRRVAEDAQKRNQFGLIIWWNWDEHKYKSKFILPSSEIYDKIASSVQDSKPVIVNASPFYSFLTTYFDWDPHAVDIPRTLLAVSLRDVVYSADFRKEIAEYCSNSGIEGPITLIPSTRLSPLYINPSL